MLSEDGEKFSGAVDGLERLVTGLAAERDPIGEAITALDNRTASLGGRLAHRRTPGAVGHGGSTDPDGAPAVQ